ncbi:hypothetical protein TNCV_1588211 [Trichonephila clavipes]|uniref:Uncharacterized protein n=1 Tax=Trichonephila clavipes TaxID=2585209 RepID=A0A8X6V592_TRICX|nr:hypothetical protein TNCV_1588211 [Trichonephila clavipes]
MPKIAFAHIVQRASKNRKGATQQVLTRPCPTTGRGFLLFGVILAGLVDHVFLERQRTPPAHFRWRTVFVLVVV